LPAAGIVNALAAACLSCAVVLLPGVGQATASLAATAATTPSGTAYVVNAGTFFTPSGTVTVISTAVGKVIKTITVGQGPVDIAIVR
jgi:YVTN family beta-propeller protein